MNFKRLFQQTYMQYPMLSVKVLYLKDVIHHIDRHLDMTLPIDTLNGILELE